MNCGIEVLKRLNEIIEPELNQVIASCEEKITEKGLCMLDMLNELNHVIPCHAVASIYLINQTPYIAFIGFDQAGHYVLIEDINKKVKIFDPAKGHRYLSKFHFYMIWSKKAIIFDTISIKNKN